MRACCSVYINVVSVFIIVDVILCCTIFIISGIGLLFNEVFGYSFYDAIAKWIQAPLTGVLTGLPGYLSSLPLPPNFNSMFDSRK